MRGGDFQGEASCELRATRREPKDTHSPLVGFRCVYDVGHERCPAPR